MWTSAEDRRAEARRAGEALRGGLEFDLCYTSVLRRAVHTAWIVLDATGRFLEEVGPPTGG